MSKWEDQLTQHPIHNTLASLKDSLNHEELVSEDIEVNGLIDRISQAADYAVSCLGIVLPALINHGHLDKANSYLTAILSELNSFIANGNVAHLSNTTPHVDSLLPQLNALPKPLPGLEQGSFTDALLSFKSVAEKTLLSISQEKDGLREEIDKITLQSNTQDQSLSALAKLIEGYEESIQVSTKNFGDQFEELSDEYKSELAKQIDVNDNLISESIQAFKEEHLALAEKLKEENKAFVEEFQGVSSDLVQALKDKKDEASNLVQIIGNIGITGNYQKIANEEKESADKWRNIALGLMIVMVLIIGITIFCVATDGFDWRMAVFRLTAALILIVPATYAAKESSRHRANEAHNRRAELELASLDPFLEKLPVEKRHEIKEKLTGKFFGQEDSSKGDDPVTHNALVELLKIAIKSNK